MKKYKIKIFYGNSYLPGEIEANGIKYAADGMSTMFYIKNVDDESTKVIKVVPTCRLYIESIEDAK